MSDLGFLDPDPFVIRLVAAGYSSSSSTGPAWASRFKRGLLTLCAELASGRTADVGCGPGHVTAFLRGAGLDVFGGRICHRAWSNRPGPTIRRCSLRSAR